VGARIAQALVKARERTDSTHVLAAIWQMNCYECVGETLHHTLNVFATVAPQWLMSVVDADWFKRYAVCVELVRLPKLKQWDG
jgi:transposase